MSDTPAPSLTITERFAVAGMLLAEWAKIVEHGPFGGGDRPTLEDWLVETATWLKPLGAQAGEVLDALLRMLEAGEELEIHRASCALVDALDEIMPGVEGSPIEYSTGVEGEPPMSPNDPRALAHVLFPWRRWSLESHTGTEPGEEG